MVAVKRAVVEALGLQEDDGIVVLDRGNQQALGVIRVGGHDRAQTADLGEHGLRTLAVGLPAVDAATARHADGERAGKVARRAVAQTRCFGDDLVAGRVEIIGKLDFDHRAQAVGAHADRGADNAALGDRGVKHARAAVFFLQALGAAEHAAEVAHILAVDDHVVVAFQHHIHGRTQRLDHRHRACFHIPNSWRWRRRCAGISL